jgi:hypothetical protein
MQNKIKLVSYWCLAAVIIAGPAVALAQFEAPTETSLPEGSVYGIIQAAMMWILAIVGIIGVIGFAVAGIMYLTAAGDETRIEKAKKAMLMSIIGVIVALIGLVILQAVNRWLSEETRF